ncbi:hypothetical protein SAMN05216334_10471 [Nitrosomonas ureae]|uniref:Uncharacterized protein n=1 Tax=Nitrosomonas ureae TaxID=44577 RepID=A0A1H5T9T0_9PROT|nr:hypothetical protein SAMN05216334_10471 [Nitrosomonas ureae]
MIKIKEYGSRLRYGNTHQMLQQIYPGLYLKKIKPIAFEDGRKRAMISFNS